MATTRAKFKVNSLKQIVSAGREIHAEEIDMSPVYSADPHSENHKFWEATPSGSIKLFINNKSAHGFFLPGVEYYVDFTPCDEGSI